MKFKNQVYMIYFYKHSELIYTQREMNSNSKYLSLLH